MSNLDALLRTALAAVALLVAAPAAALDLDGAKASGQAGERVDGYVGAVAGSPPAEVVALVNAVNAKRRAHYADIAKRNGVPVDAVAAEAGRKLVDRAPPGQWVADASGRWRKK